MEFDFFSAKINKMAGSYRLNMKRGTRMRGSLVW